MEVDSDNELLIQLASGASIDGPYWPDLRKDILTRLDKIAHEQFPIPSLPLPRPLPTPPETDEQGRPIQPVPSSAGPSSQQSAADADKENAPAGAPAAPPPPEPQQLEPGQLPQQIAEMYEGIVGQINKFEKQPPHTIQRLAELVLRPGRHYKALGPYLHAVDRVARVTSTVANYPLPPAIPDMSGLSKDGAGGDEGDDPATQVAWSNPTNSTLGTDEALGGALLTPIPWLTQRSPEKPAPETPGAQIHSESTETIEGPNGIGSIETVSVSVNGIRSAGHTRAITQGELLRQEQRAGVVPVIQLSRSQEANRAAEEANDGETGPGISGKDGDVDVVDDSQPFDDEAAGEEEEEAPHARGPDEIGVGDTGPQKEGATFPNVGLEAHDIDVEAAVGRKHEDEGASLTPPPDEGAEADTDTKSSTATLGRSSPGAESTSSSTSTKRGPEDSPEGEPAKKHLKEEGALDGGVSESSKESDEAAVAQAKEESDPDAADGEKMDTDK